VEHVVRRVVTGHDANGSAIIAMDGPAPEVRIRPQLRGVAFIEIWNTSQTPAPIDNGPDPTPHSLAHTPAPVPNGSVIRVVDLPSEPPGYYSPQSGQQHPAWHRTETIDYGIVLSGEVYLVLDNGVETLLRAGDIVVQRGTWHAWSNRSGKHCRIAFILLDGHFTDEIPNHEHRPPTSLASEATRQQ
jgi:uncharacterized cupin superfamily protein